jgi:acyl-CoA reductase-like NAD-dependent aldehyde dehydrogenase
MKDYKMFIDGQFVDAVSKKTLTVINPANQEEIGQIPAGDKADIDRAVAAAKKAYPVWSKMSQDARSAILTRLADILAQYAPELAKMELLDHGFPLNAAERWGGLPSGSFRQAAELAKNLHGETAPYRSSALVALQYVPIGVCGLITPWNFPLWTASVKLAPCVAVGNTCVLKPPSVDSLSLLVLAEAIAKSELPPGVINIVTGSGSTAGEALAAHPDVRMVSFTGSSQTGKRIMELASSNVKRMSMELGGKNPFIVLDDANLEAAVESGIRASFYNVGQICAAPGKYYVHEKIYAAFIEKYVAAVKRIKIGLPENADTQLGPLASEEQRKTVEYYIKSGQAEGAKLILGGGRPDSAPLNKGFYVMPTVFIDATQNMKIAREEIFGPVVVMLKFSSDEEVIRLANDNVYGLAASVWSRDTARAVRIANEIEAGTVWVNGHLSGESGVPWGGFKESGFGKEGTHIGLHEYTQLKTVCIDLINADHIPGNELP